MYNTSVSLPFFRRMEDEYSKNGKGYSRGAIITMGNVNADLGMIKLKSKKGYVLGHISLIYRCALKEVDFRDLKYVGCSGTSELIEIFKKKRNSTNRESEITVMRFVINKISSNEI